MASRDHAVLTLRDLHVAYRRTDHDALDGATCDIGPGVTFLVGQNGAGKTTLFKALLGALPVRAGELTVDAGGSAPRLGYLPQEFALPARVRLAAYLRYVGWLKGLPRAALPGEVARVLEQVGLTDRAHDRMGALSGGMRRRVGLAHALLGDPRVVLLDEPMAGLDPIVRSEMRTLLAALGPGRTLLISTHLVEDIALLDAPAHVVVLDRGRVAFSGPRERIPPPEGVAVDASNPRALQEQSLAALMTGRATGAWR